MWEKASFQLRIHSSWKDFRPPYISEDVWADYIQHVTSAFQSTVTIWCKELVPMCSWFCYHAYWWICSICFTWEADDKIFFITSFFGLLIFINIFNWQHFLSCRLWFLDASKARWSFLLKHMCKVMIAKKGCNSLQIAKLCTLWYVGF